ncbi:MAG: transcriptional regulator [Micromonosporaceae bacterium]|nr:transcriptional regulator [Micromonosporaceae bacterium]
MKTYTVRAEWDTTGWWVVTVPDIRGAITQSRRLDQVAGDVAEVIELMTGETPGSYEIDLQWSVPVPAGAKAHEARDLRAEAEAADERAAAATGEAVRALFAEGFTYRDIGAMIGVSYQRAQQLAPGKARRAQSWGPVRKARRKVS